MADPNSLFELRAMVLGRLAMSVRSQDAKDQVDRELNSSLAQLAADAPDAFEQDECDVDVLSTFTFATKEWSISTASTAAVIDGRVLEILTAAGGLLGGSALLPTLTGTWDGRYWLRIVDSNGDVFTLQTREWYVEEVVGVNRYYVSLVRPHNMVHTVGTVLTDVTVYQPHMWFPGDVRDADLYPIDGQAPSGRLERLSPGTANRAIGTTRAQISTGAITTYWRESRFSMDDPISAPLAEPAEALSWGTEFPQVKVEICYTIAWGRKAGLSDPKNPRGLVEPLWESAPSPIVTWDHADNPTKIIVMSAYNVDAMVGFDHSTLAASQHKGHSGLRVRWWVRVVNTVGSTAGFYHNMPSNNKFYLLAEVSGNALETASGANRYGAYVWDGANVPDFEVPLQPVSGYYGYGYARLAAEDTSITFRVRRMPEQIKHDYGTVRLRRDGLDALITKTMAPMLRARGRESEAVNADMRYDTLVAKLAARDGDHGGEIIPSDMSAGSDYFYPVYQDVTG